MIAQSTKEANVTAVHNPLFASHEPAYATRAFVAGADIKQYQLVNYDVNTGGCSPTTVVPPAVAGTQVQIGIAAFDAKSGSSVSVFIQGNLNVEKLNLTAIPSVSGFDPKATAKYLNKSGYPGLTFSVVGQNDVTHA